MTTASYSVEANVKAELVRRGLQHGDLADALGISRAAMSRRLTGEMEFSASELAKVAAFLELPVGNLLGEVRA